MSRRESGPPSESERKFLMDQGLALPPPPKPTDHAYFASSESRQASLLVGLLMRNMFLAFATRFFKNVVFKLIDRHRLFLNDILE